jgi:hypothetical protein
MKISFNPEENQVFLTDSDVLSVFKKKENKKEIQQGMSPNTIAEIVSDHLIKVVRKQFEEKAAKKIEK